MLTCVSSKTRSHDVVGASGEAKMESSQGEAEGYLQGGESCFPKKGAELRGFGYTDLLGSSQIFKNQAGTVSGYSGST